MQHTVPPKRSSVGKSSSHLQRARSQPTRMAPSCCASSAVDRGQIKVKSKRSLIIFRLGRLQRPRSALPHKSSTKFEEGERMCNRFQMRRNRRKCAPRSR
uniref:(northern house mosquito) hypothetical protein n=1 Tax=Culex pipiens TaxID=7175 RepID=A0A8D8NHR7_CULPI